MTLRMAIVPALLSALVVVAGAPSTVAAQDRDGDGSVAREAGGDDCDDSDPRRYPGNAEVADRDAHDEDCDPTTFGFEDADGDGYPAAWACNVTAGGRSYCGSDCDDANPSVHPHQIDVCNNRDDNCSGGRDEDQPCEMLERFREDPGVRPETPEEERRRRDAMREQAGEAVERAGAGDRPDVRLPRQAPMPGDGGGGACRGAVQGEIAWNYRGSTRWAAPNVARLCRGAEGSTAPARCFDRAMHGGEGDRGLGGRRWTWQEALGLCQGTRDADATLGCFRDRVAQGMSRQRAVGACSGRD